MADLGALLGAAGVGGAIGQAIVRLELDTSKYNAEMKAAQAQTTASANAMGESTSKFAGLGKAAFATVGIAAVAGLAAAVKAASDLNESLNKANVVFGNSAKAVVAFSETSAEKLGISQQAALEAAAGFGAMAQSAGLTEKASTDLSTKMVTLSADMASFNNIDPSEALEKLRSGLAGEAEPLRRFGVFISEARVEAVAYKEGIAKVGEELTDAQKIQARYNIIMQDTAKQQGDFARTLGESLPNQIRVLKAELIDTAAHIGQKLLPAFLDIAKALKDLLPILEFVAQGLADIVSVATDAVAVLAKLLTLKFDELGNQFDVSTAGAQRLFDQYDRGAITIIQLDNQLRQLRETTGFNVDVNDAYVETLHEARDAVERQKQASMEWQQVLEAQGKATEEAGKKVAEFAHMTADELKEWKTEFKDDIRTAIFALKDLTTDTDVTAEDFVSATQMMLDQAESLSRSLREIARKSKDFIPDDYIVFLREQGPEWINAFADLNEAAQRKAVKAWEEARDATDKADQAINRVVDSTDRLDNTTTKHTVEIHYKYVDFDPSKPGMGGGGQP